MSVGRPTVLLEHHLKALKLPTILREYAPVAVSLKRASGRITRRTWSVWRSEN